MTLLVLRCTCFSTFFTIETLWKPLKLWICDKGNGETVMQCNSVIANHMRKGTIVACVKLKVHLHRLLMKLHCVSVCEWNQCVVAVVNQISFLLTHMYVIFTYLFFWRVQLRPFHSMPSMHRPDSHIHSSGWFTHLRLFMYNNLYNNALEFILLAAH